MTARRKTTTRKAKSGTTGPRSGGRLQRAIDETVRREIRAALQETDGNVAAAARALGITQMWLMAGGTIADVQRNLGHSTPVLTTETYGHIGEDHRVREADTRLTLGLPKAELHLLDKETASQT